MPSPLPKRLRDRHRDLEIQLVDVTPGPALAWLERGHHRMGRAREMFRGMLIGRAVTTADMTTGQTETKMHPGRPGFEAFFTALGVSSHGMKIGRVRTGHKSPPLAEER